MIKSVFKTVSGMVMVFNEHGEQIPKYQGPYEAVKESILRDAPEDAEFYDEIIVKPISRETW